MGCASEHAHKSYSSENTPGSSSSNEESTLPTFHPTLSALGGLPGSAVVIVLLRAVWVCLWDCGRPVNAPAVLVDLILRLPSAWYSPLLLTSNPVEMRLIRGGGPRPIEAFKLSASEDGSRGGKDMRG